MVRFDELGLGWNLVALVLCAFIVWFAGTRLSRLAKIISDRMGGKPTMVGTLLLGGVVSLPEATTSVSATGMGNALLGINTLLGGISVTMLMLAVVDGIKGWEPLTFDVDHPVILLQAVITILFLLVVAAGLVTGDFSFLGAGVWTTLLLAFYFFSLYLTRRYERVMPWVPKHRMRTPKSTEASSGNGGISNSALVLRTSVTAVFIIAASYVLAQVGDVLAQQSGVGSSFVGLVLGGLITSLPELSTTLAAIRLRQYEMAFADAFGTNLFSLMLLYFADLAYPGQPILNEAGRFSLFSVLLGIALTAVYLAGLIIRRRYSVLRFGLDSLVVIFLYGAGVILLFQMRNG